MFLCLTRPPGAIALFLHSYFAVGCEIAGRLAFVIPCIWDSFFLVKKLLCSSVPLSFGSGLFPVVPSSVQLTILTWLGQGGGAHASAPQEPGVFNSHVKNKCFLKMCNYECACVLIIY